MENDQPHADPDPQEQPDLAGAHVGGVILSGVLSALLVIVIFILKEATVGRDMLAGMLVFCSIVLFMSLLRKRYAYHICSITLILFFTVDGISRLLPFPGTTYNLPLGIFQVIFGIYLLLFFFEIRSSA